MPQDTTEISISRTQAVVGVLVALVVMVAAGQALAYSFYLYAPTDQFYQVNHIEVCDAQTSDEMVSVFYTRRLSQPTTVEYSIRLQRLDSAGNVVTADQRTGRTLLASGTKTVRIEYPLPEGLPADEYWISAVLRLELPPYDVHRTVEIRTNDFSLVRHMNEATPVPGSFDRCSSASRSIAP